MAMDHILVQNNIRTKMFQLFVLLLYSRLVMMCCVQYVGWMISNVMVYALQLFVNMD